MLKIDGHIQISDKTTIDLRYLPFGVYVVYYTGFLGLDDDMLDILMQWAILWHYQTTLYHIVSVYLLQFTVFGIIQLASNCVIEKQQRERKHRLQSKTWRLKILNISVIQQILLRFPKMGATCT